MSLSEQNLLDCVHEHPYGIKDDGDSTQEFGKALFDTMGILLYVGLDVPHHEATLKPLV